MIHTCDLLLQNLLRPYTHKSFLPGHIRPISTSQACRAEAELNDGDLVYRGTIASMVRNVKLLSLSTSAIGLGLQPYLFMQVEELGMGTVAMGGVFSMFIFVTPLLLHYVTKKYVTELYMKPEEQQFTAYTINFFLRKKKTIFTPDDVSVPGVPGPFSSILVKGVPLFMDPSYFTEPNAYRIMMGYDKPIDWDFPESIKDEFHVKKSAEDEINGRK